MNVELRWPTVPATVQMQQMSTQGKFLSLRQVATTGESVHPRMGPCPSHIGLLCTLPMKEMQDILLQIACWHAFERLAQSTTSRRNRVLLHKMSVLTPRLDICLDD